MIATLVFFTLLNQASEAPRSAPEQSTGGQPTGDAGRPGGFAWPEPSLSAAIDAGAELQTIVTATRAARPRASVPVTAIVIPRAEIDRAAAMTLDGILRGEPSASTFRRNTSLVADPTAQGVNLRGVGPSGVSRALVLLDGIPVNDPFGGWVFWRSLPKLGLEQVEIIPGPGSALYGSSALGGVIQLISRKPTASTLEAEAAGGNLGTVQLAARGSHAWDTGGATLEGGLLRTDGHFIVRNPGAVDRPARGDDVNLLGRIDVAATANSRLGARAGYFTQSQNGGTAFTDSRVELLTTAATWDWTPPGRGQLQTSVYARFGELDQRRARVAPDRSAETLASQQAVPFADQGGAIIYHLEPAHLVGVHRFSFGLDVRRATGQSREATREAGGEQQFGGLFIQDTVALGERIDLLASLRADGWRNLSGQNGDTFFPERSEGAISPRAGILWRPLDALTFRTSAGTGFRAPTLNELYRPFQVGTILTAANETLIAERIVGVEAGVEVEPVNGFVSRVTGFWNRLQNPVTNVTLPSGARQRQNLGAARIQGIEAAIQARFLRRWSVLAAYTFVDARVIEAGTTGLSGKRLAQDPQHRGSASIAFADPRLFTAMVELRVTGPQFEDDQNLLEMGGYPLVNFTVSKRIWKGFELFGAVENLLDRRYVVGRAGLDTYGAPLMGRVGLRLR